MVDYKDGSKERGPWEDAPLIVPCFYGKELDVRPEVAMTGLAAIALKAPSRRPPPLPSVLRPAPTPAICERNSFWDLHRPELSKLAWAAAATDRDVREFFHIHSAFQTRRWVKMAPAKDPEDVEMLLQEAKETSAHRRLQTDQLPQEVRPPRSMERRARNFADLSRVASAVVGDEAATTETAAPLSAPATGRRHHHHHHQLQGSSPVSSSFRRDTIEADAIASAIANAAAAATAVEGEDEADEVEKEAKEEEDDAEALAEVELSIAESVELLIADIVDSPPVADVEGDPAAEIQLQEGGAVEEKGEALESEAGVEGDAGKQAEVDWKGDALFGEKGDADGGARADVDSTGDAADAVEVTVKTGEQGEGPTPSTLASAKDEPRA